MMPVAKPGKRPRNQLLTPIRTEADEGRDYSTLLSGIKTGVDKEFMAEFDQWEEAMKQSDKPPEVLAPFIEDTTTDLEDLGKLAVATPGYVASKLGLLGKENRPTPEESAEYNRLFGQNVGNLLLYPTKRVRGGVSAASIWSGLARQYLGREGAFTGKRQKLTPYWK